MIASISKGSNYAGILAYHEQKIKEGKASLLFDGTYSPDRDYTSAFDDLFCIYARDNMKNKVAHISLSLPVGEKLNDADFMKITREYLFKMGYKDCPYVVFRHKDKDHDHLHIVVSSIDGHGKKVKDFCDFKKSQDISRELESKYNLKETKYNLQSDRASLTEINFRKYYMHKAIFKSSRGYNTKVFIATFFTEKQKKAIFVKTPLTQKQVQSVLGKEKFDTLYNYLHEKGYFNSLYKDELSFKLEDILKESKTLKDYVAGCKANNIYVRTMYGKDTKPYFKYGLIEERIYFKDTNLSARFRFDNVIKGMGYSEGKNKLNQSQGEQFRYIDKAIKEAFEKGDSYINFADYLDKKGVEVIFDENKSGPYNIRFRNCIATTPIIFDCNDFGLNFRDIISKSNEPVENISNSFETGVYENFLYEMDAPFENVILNNPKKHHEDNTSLSGKRKRKLPGR